MVEVVLPAGAVALSVTYLWLLRRPVVDRSAGHWAELFAVAVALLAACALGAVVLDGVQATLFALLILLVGAMLWGLGLWWSRRAEGGRG